MYRNLEDRPDETVICPYNKTHKIRRSKLQKHLVKCEKNYPEDYLEICPFNALHRFPKAEMENHCSSCPAYSFLAPKPQKKNVGSNIFVRSKTLVNRSNTDDFTECWSDDDVDSGFESIENKSAIKQVEKKIEDVKLQTVCEDIRRPKGLSQLLLMEDSDSDDEIEEDTRSVTSWMCMGRGRSTVNPLHKDLLKKLALGRARPLPS